MSWKSLGYETYWEYLQGREWQWRRKIMLEEFPKCYKCKKWASQVHHKNYERCGQEKSTDLLSLCSKCHEEVKKDE